MFDAKILSYLRIHNRGSTPKDSTKIMSAPPYGFPGFMPTFDEDGARKYLQENGFPAGFGELLISQSEKVAHRFFVSSFRPYIDMWSYFPSDH